MKYCVATLLLVLGSPMAHSDTQTYHCMDCTDLQMKQLAESRRPSGYKDIVYVFNTERELVRTYEVKKQTIDDFIEHIVANEIVTPTNVRTRYEEYLQAREDVLDTFIYSGIQSTTSYSRKSTDSNPSYNCLADSEVGNVDIHMTTASAHEFIVDSSLREQVFSEITNRDDVWTTFASAYNTLNFTVSSVLQLDDMTFRLRFANGSSVVVEPNRLKDGIEYSQDSGLDSDCNQLPSDPSWAGKFTFSSLENYHAMEDYLWYLSVNWVQEFKHFEGNSGCTIDTKCRQEENVLTCYGSVQCE